MMKKTSSTGGGGSKKEGEGKKAAAATATKSPKPKAATKSATPKPTPTPTVTKDEAIANDDAVDESDDGGFVLGIDEAGRGPVLGPMVYGACWCPRIHRDELAKLGFADSKKLTASERDRLLSVIKNTSWLGWAVDIISPQDMSVKMLRRSKYSLNAISHDSAIGLIRRALAADVRVTEVYVDTVGPPEKYQDMLSNIFPNIKFTVSKKADSLFPIVSAASICAKVTRDQCLDDWQFVEAKQGMDISRDMGSGYPADEKTSTWLKDHFDATFGWPSITRFSWAPCTAMFKERGTPVIWDDDEDDSGNPIIPQQGMQTLSSFFAAAPSPSSSSSNGNGNGGKTAAARAQVPIAMRNTYFQTRHMNVTTSF